ncbi:MAG: PAS domain S-box protein [Deltaproteobacteria bacterium]|nr:PAS domain S-box protein [Deltaproteobacteria bacterium]
MEQDHPCIQSLARLIADMPGVLVMGFDPEGLIKHFNRGCEELTGFTLEEVAGKPLWDTLIPGKWRAYVHEEIERLREGEQFIVLEFPLTTRSGKKADVIWRKALIRDEGGRNPLILGIGFDISHLREMHRDLLNSEERYRSLFRSIRDVLIHTDLDRRIIDANETALEELFGYTLDELRGKTTNMLDATPREELSQAMESRAPGQETRKYKQVYLKKKNGEIFLAEITPIHVKNSKGEKIGYLGIIRDISEQKRMQEQLIQSEKLAALGMMVSGVAHELNNPLTGIQGYSEYLLSKKSEISEKVLQDVQVIHQEARRAADIVRNLLTFARQQESKETLLNLNSIIRSVMELQAFHLSRGNIEVVLNLDEDIPSMVGDFNQLQQVLLNILNNAREAISETKERGTIIIQSRYEWPFARIEIQDDGPGIREGIKNRIFDPFFTTKPVGKGTGLGLSIAFGIIKEHGGNIYADSEPGKGATFVIELPVPGDNETPGRGH